MQRNLERSSYERHPHLDISLLMDDIYRIPGVFVFLSMLSLLAVVADDI